MKIVLNKCFGGFSVTKAVFDELNIKWDNYGYLDNKTFGIESENYLAYRADNRLIAAIEKIGIKESTGEMAKLRIVNLPDNIEWHIDNYDGVETVHETHRSW